MKNTKRGFVPLILLLIIAVTVIAGVTFYIIKKDKAIETNIVFTQLSNGGFCLGEEGCNMLAILMKDGNGKTIKPISKEVTATWNIKMEDVNKLIEAIEKTNFSEMRKNKFTEMCPVAYDGFNQVYTFYTTHGQETIDDCVTKIDENQPLFQLISLIFSE